MIAKTRLYWNADRTALVPDGPGAAFLAFIEGEEIPAKHAGKIQAESAEPDSGPVDSLDDRQHRPTRRRNKSP